MKDEIGLETKRKIRRNKKINALSCLLHMIMGEELGFSVAVVVFLICGLRQDTEEFMGRQ